MNARSLFAAIIALGAILGCNGERKQECDRFLRALDPLGGSPTADAVDRAQGAVGAIQFQDQPLREYAAGAKTTLTVLSNALKTQASPSPPDGTDDLVKAKLKEVQGERDEVTRYCAE